MVSTPSNAKSPSRNNVYRDEQARQSYLEAHPYAGPIDPMGCWVLCRACVKRNSKSGILYPSSILLDARKGSKYDLTAFRKHCRRKHEPMHLLWERSGRPSRKVRCEWDAEMWVVFGRDIVPSLEKRRLQRKLVVRNVQRDNGVSTATVGAEWDSRTEVADDSTTPTAEKIHPETGVSCRALALLTSLLRKPQS